MFCWTQALVVPSGALAQTCMQLWDLGWLLVGDLVVCHGPFGDTGMALPNVPKLFSEQFSPTGSIARSFNRHLHQSPFLFAPKSRSRLVPSLLQRDVCYSEQNIMLPCYLIMSKFIGSICAEDKMFRDSLVLFLSEQLRLCKDFSFKHGDGVS